MTMGVTQIGHSADDGGEGTVNMGRRVIEEIGGSMRWVLSEDEEVGRGFSKASVGLDGCCLAEGGREGSIGGGRSIFSAAFRDNCRAKSEACHHSRNLRAKMLVGSNIFNELKSRGCTLRTRFLGESIDPPSPGRAGPTFLGAVASSMALWSASPKRRILVPISHMNGEWYFVPSKRYAMLKTSSEK